MATAGSSPGESEGPLIIAHRGDSAKAPENTAAAILSAVAARADWVEFDVRETADGRLLLFHDRDLERIAGRPGTLEALGFEEARQLDVGMWFDEAKTFAGENPPTLEEAVRFCLVGGATPLIERKSGPAETYAGIIRELGAADRVVVQAFDWAFLRELRAAAPEIRIGALGDKALDPARESELKALAPQWIGWNHQHLDRAGIERMRGLGAKVAVWTVNDLARLRQFAAWGVDGLITDRPAEAREAVAGVEPEREPGSE